MRLLVVDDDPGIVDILSLSLSQFGHEVDEAHSGIEALELLKNNSYDVAILDAVMPGMNGVEVCKFIKAHFPAIYIIGISGYPNYLEKLKNEGADICFIKPFRIDEIKNAIENRFRSSPTDV